MALLEYNEITEKKYIVLDGAPYEVISSHVFRKQQRKPVNATKLKNLLTGKVTEYSFHQSEKIPDAPMAAYFERTAKACGQAKLASNWVMGEISRRLNTEEIGMDAVKVSSEQLAALIGRISDGTISNNAAKQ